jgi:hypothetical protein
LSEKNPAFRALALPVWQAASCNNGICKDCSGTGRHMNPRFRLNLQLGFQLGFLLDLATPGL